MILTRRAFAAALSLAALAAFAPHLIGSAMAQTPTAALVAKPVSLPDMALGSVKAPITITELDRMSDVVKKDPRILAALKARGITDLSSVRCEPIPITFIAFPEQSTQRIGYGDCTDSHGVYHPWGRAVEGLYFLANLTTEKILDVVDHAPVAMPSGDISFEETEATPRPGTTPLP